MGCDAFGYGYSISESSNAAAIIGNAVANAQSRFELLLGIEYLFILYFVPETGIEALAITVLPRCQRLVIRSLHIDARLIQRMKRPQR